MTNEWRLKADYPGLGRAGRISFSIGGKGYVGGGVNIGRTPQATEVYSDFWEYDPGSNSWTMKSRLNGQGRYLDFPCDSGDPNDPYLKTGHRSGSFSLTISGKGYIGGGHSDFLYSDFIKYCDFWSLPLILP